MENRMNTLTFMLNNNYVALFHMDGNEFTTSFFYQSFKMNFTIKRNK